MSEKVKMFPVLMDYRERKEFPNAPVSVPWELLQPHALQALANHGQTLERLAERGGLHPGEMYLILHNLPWDGGRLPATAIALQFIDQKIMELSRRATVSQCEHKTEAEYGLCHRCQAFAVIARNAKVMLEKRKAYMEILLVDAKASDPAQMELQDAVKDLERSVDFATQSNLWE